ncbi:glycoside hydrolase [Neoconidiobolus thromboides FSU 785]|nr:glycoside hydrolase [Neoconidiobolus thromboides FSU 785]
MDRMAKNYRESVNKVTSFVIQNGLDGIDINWEYPEAQDIPNTPPGSKEDGMNYLTFLKALKEVLPKEKSIAIAIPASCCYLKAFPVGKMSRVVDYFVFMTYDLHKQCGFNNIWTRGFLKSHANKREIKDMLSFLTHGGADSNKAVMRVDNYGRSFGMKDRGY